MKRFALLACVSALALATEVSKGQNGPQDLSGADSSSADTPQQACDAIFKAFDEWVERRGVGVNGAGASQYADLAKHLPNVGMSNLIAVTAAVDCYYDGDAAQRYVLTGALWQIIDERAGKDDLPAMINAANEDPEFIVHITKNSSFCNDERVITMIGNGLSDEAGHSSEKSAFERDITQPVSLGKLKSQSQSIVEKDRLAILLSATLVVANSDLRKKMRDLVSDAAQNGTNYSFPVIYQLLKFCENPLANAPSGIPITWRKEDALDKYFPGLLSALADDKFRPEAEAKFSETRATVGMFIKDHRPLCGTQEMQDAVHSLAKSAARDHGESYEGLDSLALLASVGDESALKDVVRNYRSDLRDASVVRLQREEALLNSVLYQGPKDDYLKVICDNLDACKFDAAQGGWSVTIPGYESAPAATHEVVPGAGTQWQ